MKASITFFCLIIYFLISTPLSAQKVDSKIVDVVWLKDGSKLSGTILKWDLASGMELQLITGAVVIIDKQNISRVFQHDPNASPLEARRRNFIREDKPYSFKEEGIYHTFSGFINFSLFGGAGLHYSIGHRFNRMLSVGIGTGIETHDFGSSRRIVPLYAEARGFILEKKISPYYALKAGYGFAFKDEPSGVIEAKGGLHISPEIGVRFGANAVSYYLGVEYKLQNATFVNNAWSWDGQGTFTDKISYRRIELRTGLVF